MSFIQILSLSFLIFTFYLLIKKKIYGKSFIYFGGLTYLFVTLYTLLPNISIIYKSFALFICFSLLLILFGLMCGTIFLLIKKEERISQLVSILSSIILMFLLFNNQSLLSYIYIPVLMYILQFKFNENFVIKK